MLPTFWDKLSEADKKSIVVIVLQRIIRDINRDPNNPPSAGEMPEGISSRAIAQAVISAFRNVMATQDLMSRFDERLTKIVNDKSVYVFNQDEPNCRWAILHNLNKAYVRYSLYDEDFDKIHGTENRRESTKDCLIIDFDIPVAGLAVLDL